MMLVSFAKKSLIALTTSCVSLLAAADPSVSPALYNQGFAMLRLNALTAEINKDVRNARLPGAVILVARNGNLVYAETVGVQDPKTAAPMKRDTIFRLYSMTKPLVSVAAMLMVEEGKIFLADPVSKYLPELANLKVGIEWTDARGAQILDVVPAKREMTIHDLLRHTAGLTYGFEGKSLVKDEYKKNAIDSASQTNAEWIEKLAKLPLQSQPGAKWEYSIATDVLGLLLERVSGQSLEALLTERIFRPLGMKDTAFSVETVKQNRIAEPIEIDPVWKTKVVLSDVRKPPARYSGGSGAVSTADDYLRFAQMLLNGGELDGVRILSPKTVDYMLADHLSGVRATLPASSAAPGPRPGYGFGLGFAIRNEIGEASTLGSIGIADWNGLGGTNFWIDPKEKLAVIWMAQAPGLRPYYRQLIPNMVYGAMMK
jgi:CubicO group peptidase (beta-lactamase class C family)